MGRRTLTSLVLLAIGVPAVLFGGIPYFILISIFLGGSAWEYARMFRAMEYKPSELLTIAGTLLIVGARAFYPQAATAIMSFFILLAMTYHLFEYEKGRDHAGVDLVITIGGIAYLGWVGAYLIDLRNLPDGGWWLMLALPIIWLADSGAYTLGVAYGKTRMSPRLSPKKTWEGFAAGVFTAVISGAFLAWAYATYGRLGGQVTPLQGAILGLVLGILTPLGDLAESLFKRQAGMKDSSNVFPGHGGFFDRIDSWLWGAIIGYYFIVWFF